MADSHGEELVEIARVRLAPPANSVDVVTGVLLGCAAKRATVTYTTLAKILGLNLGWQSHRAQLGEILGDVSARSQRDWGFLLSALAVGKGDNMPSGRTDPDNPSGFYGIARDLGLDLENPEQLVISEQRKAYNWVEKGAAA
jgi:hypothetical protein